VKYFAESDKILSNTLKEPSLIEIRRSVSPHFQKQPLHLYLKGTLDCMGSLKKGTELSSPILLGTFFWRAVL
jgi:hypothetical protein